jgi:hypothetical protein
MWNLIRKELLENLLTLRLGVALVFSVLLAVMATLIGSVDFSTNYDAYENRVASLRDDLGKATVYRQVNANVMVPPMPLSILSRGTVVTSGQIVFLGIDYVPISTCTSTLTTGSGWGFCSPSPVFF